MLLMQKPLLNTLTSLINLLFSFFPSPFDLHLDCNFFYRVQSVFFECKNKMVLTGLSLLYSVAQKCFHIFSHCKPQTTCQHCRYYIIN